MHSSDLPFSQACENNQAPILVVLRDWLAHSKRVLEIGTGTGQHAVHFATGLTHLHWLPSDHPETLWQSRERLARDAPANLQQPALALDVAQRPWPDLQVDAVDPDVDVVALGQGALVEGAGLVLPVLGQPRDRGR